MYEQAVPLFLPSLLVPHPDLPFDVVVDDDDVLSFRIRVLATPRCLDDGSAGGRDLDLVRLALLAQLRFLDRMHPVHPAFARFESFAVASAGPANHPFAN